MKAFRANFPSSSSRIRKGRCHIWGLQWYFSLMILNFSITLISVIIIGRCLLIDKESVFLIDFKDGFYYKIFEAVLNKSKNGRNKHYQVEDFDGFFIHPFQRFGNHLYQFTRILQYCDIFNYKMVVIPENFLLFQKDFYANDIKIKIRTPTDDLSRLIHGHFFWPLTGGIVPINFSYTSYFKDELIKYIPNKTLGKNDIYLHVRAGDVYVKDRHPNYGQPPLQYYLDIMKFKKWDNIYFISENFICPYIPNIVQNGAVYVNTTFLDSISIFLNAYNLAIGKTTFPIMLSFMNSNLNNFFTFNFPTYKLKSHYNCDPDNHYIRRIINHWKHNERQISLLFKSRCANWSFFENKRVDEPDATLFHNDHVFGYWFK